MEAPLGITFLRKAELYALLGRLDRQAREIRRSKSGDSPLWDIEKAILKWTYLHHKHLGSPITTEHLSLGHRDNKLKDFGMLTKYGKLKRQYAALQNVSLHKPLENIVIREFGSYFSDALGHNAIVINKEGLLVGEVIAEFEESRFISNVNYAYYNWLMGHYGAFILLILTLWAIIRFIFDDLLP